MRYGASAPGVGYFISGAPLVVNGKVIIRDGGGEYGARGFIVGLNAETGKLVWKTYTTAAPGTPGGDSWPKGAYKTGGGNPWITGTYDHATNTLFWGVGNPGPWLATLRPGENLYTDSVLELDDVAGVDLIKRCIAGALVVTSITSASRCPAGR